MLMITMALEVHNTTLIGQRRPCVALLKEFFASSQFHQFRATTDFNICGDRKLNKLQKKNYLSDFVSPLFRYQKLCSVVT